MIAFVLAVTFRLRSAGSMSSVPGRTSTNTGLAPSSSMSLQVDGHVIETVITSSPGPMPMAASSTCSPAVPEFSASACGTWSRSRNTFSKAATLGPVVIQPLFSDSTTDAISSSSIVGRQNGMKSASLIGPPADAAKCLRKPAAREQRGRARSPPGSVRGLHRGLHDLHLVGELAFRELRPDELPVDRHLEPPADAGHELERLEPLLEVRHQRVGKAHGLGFVVSLIAVVDADLHGLGEYTPWRGFGATA